MKSKHYIVTFTNGKKVYSDAFNEEEATILAQAIMIKFGFTYSVFYIEEVHDKSNMDKVDFIA